MFCLQKSIYKSFHSFGLLHHADISHTVVRIFLKLIPIDSSSFGRLWWHNELYIVPCCRTYGLRTHLRSVPYNTVYENRWQNIKINLNCIKNKRQEQWNVPLNTDSNKQIRNTVQYHYRKCTAMNRGYIFRVCACFSGSRFTLRSMSP